MHLSEENGWTAGQTEGAAESIGFDWKGGHPMTAKIFQDYLNRRSKG